MKQSGLQPITMGKELTLLVEQVTKQAYRVLDELPESEQWDLQAKIRSQAVSAASNVAEGCGGLDPRDVTWRLSQARGNLAALESLIKIAHQVGRVELEPEQMVEIKRAIDIIDEAIPTLPAKTKTWLDTYYPSSGAKNHEN